MNPGTCLVASCRMYGSRRLRQSTVDHCMDRCNPEACLSIRLHRFHRNRRHRSNFVSSVGNCREDRMEWTVEIQHHHSQNIRPRSPGHNSHWMQVLRLKIAKPKYESSNRSPKIYSCTIVMTKPRNLNAIPGDRICTGWISASKALPIKKIRIIEKVYLGSSIPVRNIVPTSSARDCVSCVNA